MTIVLASESAARQRLLIASGIAAIADAARIDEGDVKRAFRAEGRQAADCALALAAKKAETVAPRHADAVVIGADQILECDGLWFDKPHDLDDARVQLRALRGRAHELATAVVAVRGGTVAWRHVERARLVMRDLSDDFLDAYITAMGEDLCRTVGGYQLEGLGAQLFARIDGDYFAILGLPLLPLLDFLRSAGAMPR
jgi:septum formation protein